MIQEEHNNLMHQIKSGEVKMRSKSYFMVKTALQLLGLILAVLLAVFLASYAFFQFKMSGAAGLANFGLFGVKDLLLSLPWLILFFTLIFVGLLLWFAESYSITYRNPLLYSALGILLIVFVGGFLVAKTPLHPYFFNINAGPRPPGLFMKFYPPPPRRGMFYNGLIGKIENWEADSRLVRASDGKSYRVTVTEDTDISPDDAVLGIGDMILIHGRIFPDRAEAWEIRKIMLDEFDPGFPRFSP